jgi:tetratricopeptide (TPR) repeat protein
MFDWLNARQAVQVGAALADDLVMQMTAELPGYWQRQSDSGAHRARLLKLMDGLLERVDREARPLQLNSFKRARLARSFKWRLLDRGLAPRIVDELRLALVGRLCTQTVEPGVGAMRPAASLPRPEPIDVSALLAEGTGHLKGGNDAKAAECFQKVVSVDPRNATAHNNLGIAFCKMGRYQEGESQFRRAVGIAEAYADAQFNLGSLLQLQGEFSDAEMVLRRALALQPGSVKIQGVLGINLLTTGRVHEARGLIERVLQADPANANARLAMGQLAQREGRFADAETMFRRTLEVNANAHGAWVGIARARRMTSADGAWLKGAEACAASGLNSLSEADVRYAIGKYYDDTGNFTEAFSSYQRANELSRTGAVPYDRHGHARLVDDLIRVYSRAVLSEARPGASDSRLPVLVTGMPRSGTSLVEQIIASHPAAKGAGELLFWDRSFLEAEGALRQSPPGEALTKTLAQAYVCELEAHGADARRVVDKQPFNAGRLGIVHSVFPRARMVYVRRDPIDTCLSCFFQPFPPALNFTKDLSALADYYREHHRLIEHWRGALPPGTMLDVPYEELIADQEGWTRRIVDFIGLEWDERCLGFHATARAVFTASSWQVRQKLYQSSVGRWRNYEKFIGPLLELKGLD